MQLRALIAGICLAAFTTAPLHAAQANEAPVETGLDMGDDSGDWASDGQCDDVRFTGDGMAEVLLTDSIGKDAADCQAALSAGTVTINPMHAQPIDDTSILFGDDTSAFARDGECDDIRFAGSSAAEMVFIAEDIGHDASDCKSAFEAGLVKWQGSTATPELGVTANDILETIESEAPLV